MQLMDVKVKRGRPPLKVGRGRPRQIERMSLHSALVTSLREMIQNGEFAPGENLVEKHISQGFGISRTPLREALKVLSSEGLVELRPRRTPIVAPVDPNEIAAIFDVMETLERLAGQRACENATSDEMAELEAMHRAMVVEHNRGLRDSYARINRAIHARIVDFTRNAVLKDTYNRFTVKIQRARSTTNYDARRWLESVREHEQIMEAFRARNPNDASLALAEHMRRTGESVLATLQRVQTENRSRFRHPGR
jgi:DNA-binding GntR family transcriptional regulator